MNAKSITSTFYIRIIMLYDLGIYILFEKGSAIVNLYPFFPISGCLIEISHGWLVMPVSKYLISTTFALLPPTSYKLDI